MTNTTNAASVAEEQAFEAWFKQDCPVSGINAKLGAKSAWIARAALAAQPSPTAEGCECPKCQSIRTDWHAPIGDVVVTTKDDQCVAVTRQDDEGQILEVLWEANPHQAAQAVAGHCYVQPVPDHCDRIVWRNIYYHLPTSPLTAQAVPQDLESLAINRYRPVPAGVIAYKVVAGDGERSLFSGTKDECQIVARKLTEAFLDGAHAMLTAAPDTKEQPGWKLVPDSPTPEWVQAASIGVRIGSIESMISDVLAAAPSAPAQPWKDHHTRELVTKLMDAVQLYNGTDQLRERIAEVVHECLPRSNPWQQAVDAELVSAHLGIAGNVDYMEAARALSELIQWHIDVATDPRVNGGLTLQPERKPLTDTQIEAATGAKPGTPLWLVATGFVQAVEAAHGIKGDEA